MTNAVAQRDSQLMAVEAIRSRSDQFLDLLGGDERARDRWLTVALHAVTSNPDILQCEPLTVVEAVRQSASVGLELNGLMGEAYLIRYGNKAQFQVGWRGLLRLARRSGDIAAIDAQVVYSNDVFDVDLGSDPKVTHKPALSDRGNRVGVYGWARLTSGELVVEWMDNDQVEMVRRSGAKGGPWVEWYDEMARKTVIKRLCKRLPLDSLAQRALEAEARADNAARESSGTSTQPRRERPAAVQRVHERLGITSGHDLGAVPVGSDAEGTGTQQGTAAVSKDSEHPTDHAGAHADTTRTIFAGVPSVTGEAGRTPGPDPDMGEPTPAPPSAPEGDKASAGAPPPPSGAVQMCGANGGDMGTCTRSPGHAGMHSSEVGRWRD